MSTLKNKNSLRTIEAQIVQKLKNNEARPKFTGSYKKKACISIENDCDFQHSNNKHMARFLDETSQIVLSISTSSKLKLPSQNYYKVQITLTTILSGQL